MNRTPPAAVQRELRQEVGYCCPIPGCESPFLEWHHFDPKWSVQQHHNPKGMIALCSRHHKEADAGAFPDEQLGSWKISNNVGKRLVTAKLNWMRRELFVFAGAIFRNPQVMMYYDGIPLLEFSRDSVGYLQINVKTIVDGQIYTVMHKNTWQVDTDEILDLKVPPSNTGFDVKINKNTSVKLKFLEIGEFSNLKKRYLSMDKEDDYFPTGAILRAANYPITACELSMRNKPYFVLNRASLKNSARNRKLHMAGCIFDGAALHLSKDGYIDF